MPQRIDIDDFKGVFTHADLSDLPNSVATELKNFRPTNGKLVKTYDFNDISGVCPINVASGYTIRNVYTYINENLSNGYTYIAVVQNNSSKQVWVVVFNETYNLASGEPSTLLPFSENSFWVKGDSMTFNDWANIFLTGTSATDANALSYPFDGTSLWHAPNEIDDTDGSGSIAYGDIPSDLGISMYRENDAEVSFFNDTVAFNNEDIKTFDLSSLELGVVRMERAGGKTFSVTTSKGSSTTPDKLWYYTTSWTQIASTDFVPDYVAGDTLYILGIKEMSGDLYVVYYHKDVSRESATSDGYGLGLCRLYNISTSPTWSNGIWTEWLSAAQFANVTTGLTGLKHDDVKMAVQTISGTDYLFFSINGSSTGTTTCPGYLFQYSVAGGKDQLTLPTFADTNDRKTVGVAFSNETMYFFVNDLSDTEVELYSTGSPLSPSWSLEALPSSISGVTDTVATWEYLAFVDTLRAEKSYNGEYFVIMPRIDYAATATAWTLARYDERANTYYGSDSSLFASATYSINSLYASAHANRTGEYYLFNLYTSATGVSVVKAAPSATMVASTLFTATTGDVVNALLSYEKTLPSGTVASDHITSIHYLFGDLHVAASDDPQIHRIVSFGANPSYTNYPANFVYEADFSACMAWEDLFQWLDVDLETAYYHKASQNPIILNNGVLRVLAGAVGTVGANDANGIWLGYIDREFFFGGYQPSAGFKSYELFPQLPATWVAETGDFTGSAGSGGLTPGASRAYMFVPVYDGVQEDLSNDNTARTTRSAAGIVLKSTLSFKKSEISERMTAINVYRSSDDLTWGLVGTVNLSSDSNNQDYIAGASSECGDVLFVDDADISLVSVGNYVYINTNDYTITGVDTTNGAITVSTSFDTADSLWEGAWSVWTNTGGTGSLKASGASNGYCGINTLYNEDWDFSALEIAGWNAYVAGLPSDLYVANSYKKMVRLYSDITDYLFGAVGTNTVTSFTNKYRFSISGDNVTLIFFDGGLTEGASFPLDGAASVRVNSDHASVISGRLWQGRVILDAGGENEEQFSAVTYSELNQLDVTPVSNLIKLNDREGGGITGITEIFGRPVVTMKQGISLIDSKTNPSSPTSWTISESVHNIGNIAKHGLVSALGRVYVVYYDGIYELSSNNLAETDQTPTERLKISQDIDETFLAVSDKTSIIGEYDQKKNEVIWNFGSEIWAFSLVTRDWREIDSATTSTIDFITIDENADIMAFDTSDGALKSLNVAKTTTAGSTSSTWRSKRYAFNLDRKSLVRQLSVYYASDDDFTINIYLDDNTGTPDGTYSVAKRADVNVRHIPLKRYARNFQVEIVTENSANSFELNKIRLEVEE